ncbi:hypothetical protein F5Y12DRAFT_772809 [Xylaria sp. FL1777]|nr:hypothetical protein F5Y12DRAFT_772809 [Xylaria sp. FL1777]
MMPANRRRLQPQPRRHSLSSGDESFHPHPAKADGLSGLDNRRRACLPRSKSVSNVFDALGQTQGPADYDAGNVALEQVDLATLRELSSILRTTGPSPDHTTTHDDCLRLSGSGEPKRWSLQSLRRNKRMKLQRISLQLCLPGNIIPGTTTEGHRYNAISTPVSKKKSAGSTDGPWFRSQYPVFLPSSPSSPGVRLGRSSLKAATFSSTETGTASGDHRNLPRPTSRPVGEKHLRSRALSNRVSTDHLLRAMINTADEGCEHAIGAPLRILDYQRGSVLEQAQVQTLPLVAVDEEEVDRSEEGPKQAVATYMALTTKESPDETWMQSPTVSPGSRGSPRSTGRAARRLGNIHVQPSLVVPKENLAPESPGFPSMLATMTFPSPPKGSRPSSPASPASIASSIADSIGSYPMVQPRTSSRRAATSLSASATSLNEIVMQKRRGSRCMKSDRPTHSGIPAEMDTALIDEPWGSRPLTAPVEHQDSSLDKTLGEAEQGSTSYPDSNKLTCEAPIAPSYGGGEACQRGSLISRLTATTDSSRQSASTRNSSRFSSASEMSTQSKSTITAQKTYSEPSHALEPIDPSVSERCANAQTKTTATGKDGECLTETSNPNLDEKHEEHEAPSFPLSNTSNLDIEVNPQPKGIIEKRLARKAKVHEYKMRDIDASRADAADSPVLGYFQSDSPPGRDSPSPGSAPTHDIRSPSTLNMAITTGEASNETLQNTDIKAPTDLHNELPLHNRSQPEASREVLRASSVQLKISTVHTTEIEPIYPPTPHWHTGGITMSPIMVVADVESRPGSPTLRFSTPTRLESSSPRVRLKPLKIGTHLRQKSLSVTISRNPSTGAIERSASVPIDVKFNRRSLMTLPTPPMSPEARQVSKRLSLPLVQLNLPVTPRERTSPARCQEWHSSHTEEQEPASGQRSTMLKERVMREKLQKEKEITDIVAKTVGPPQKQTAYSNELDPLPLEQNNTDSLEKRLKRLERNNDAWLSAMKPLLEAMARTLDDMRVDDKSSSLRMSDFVIDMEAEARRVTHSRRGEKENTLMTWQSPSRIEPRAMGMRNALKTSGVTSSNPVLQELDNSPASGSGGAPEVSTDVGPSRKTEESRDWPDLDPLIRELRSMPHKSREELKVGGSHSPSTLGPLMRELMNASQLCAEEVIDVR